MRAWLDCVSQDLAVIDLPLAEAVRIAQHRIDWRAILRRVTSTLDDQQELFKSSQELVHTSLTWSLVTENPLSRHSYYTFLWCIHTQKNGSHLGFSMLKHLYICKWIILIQYKLAHNVLTLFEKQLCSHCQYCVKE